MDKTITDTIIIGTGLSGVYAANLLLAQNRPVLMLEARSRAGAGS
jgi:monoamine oxidase